MHRPHIPHLIVIVFTVFSALYSKNDALLKDTVDSVWNVGRLAVESGSCELCLPCEHRTSLKIIPWRLQWSPTG